jgi:hypothetical protein
LKNSPTFILGISSLGFWIDGKFYFIERSLQFSKIAYKPLGNSISPSSLLFLILASPFFFFPHRRQLYQNPSFPSSLSLFPFLSRQHRRRQRLGASSPGKRRLGRVRCGRILVCRRGDTERSGSGAAGAERARSTQEQKLGGAGGSARRRLKCAARPMAGGSGLRRSARLGRWASGSG